MTAGNTRKHPRTHAPRTTHHAPWHKHGKHPSHRATKRHRKGIELLYILSSRNWSTDDAKLCWGFIELSRYVRSTYSNNRLGESSMKKLLGAILGTWCKESPYCKILLQTGGKKLVENWDEGWMVLNSSIYLTKVISLPIFLLRQSCRITKLPSHLDVVMVSPWRLNLFSPCHCRTSVIGAGWRTKSCGWFMTLRGCRGCQPVNKSHEFRILQR